MQLHAEERKIDPTFLYRGASAVQAEKSDLTTSTCHYKPLFGKGDPDTSAVVGIARYGEAAIDPSGECAMVQYPEEDQVYVVIEGRGRRNMETKCLPQMEDYLYLRQQSPHLNESFGLADGCGRDGFPYPGI